MAIYLLDPRNMPGNVFHGNGILDRQTVTLTFHSRLVDQHPSVCSEAYIVSDQRAAPKMACERVITCERETNMII
jgi:hypothetical protein